MIQIVKASVDQNLLTDTKLELQTPALVTIFPLVSRAKLWVPLPLAASIAVAISVDEVLQCKRQKYLQWWHYQLYIPDDHQWYQVILLGVIVEKDSRERVKRESSNFRSQPALAANVMGCQWGRLEQYPITFIQ